MLPSHIVGKSHKSLAARHSNVFGRLPSAGQSTLAPSQRSSTSHTPALARHNVPELPAVCWQTLPSGEKLHVSTVHGLPSLQSAFVAHSQLSFTPAHTPSETHVDTDVLHKRSELRHQTSEQRTIDLHRRTAYPEQRRDLADKRRRNQCRSLARRTTRPVRLLDTLCSTARTLSADTLPHCPNKTRPIRTDRTFVDIASTSARTRCSDTYR